MLKRCLGTKTGGEWTGFQCVLDQGHADRFCQPYVPPDVDEWRGMKVRAMELEVRVGNWAIRAQSAEVELAAALDRERHAGETCVRLQAELDALRAVVERLRPFEAAEIQRRVIAEMMNGGEA